MRKYIIRLLYLVIPIGSLFNLFLCVYISYPYFFYFILFFFFEVKRGSSESVINVTFHVPNPPLKWDTTLPTPQAGTNAWSKGKGFEVCCIFVNNIWWKEKGCDIYV
jgi:hypothetical protein